MILGTIGAPELIIILAIVLLVFGSTQLPRLARSLGRAQKEFKKGTQEGDKDSSDEEFGERVSKAIDKGESEPTEAKAD